MTTQIQQLKNKLKDLNIKGLALDIDETLSDTGPHWFEHMLNFHNPEKMSKEEVMEQYQFIEDVPHWKTEEATKHMEETLHSNDFNEAIPLIEGADKAVQEINEIIPIIAYITARPGTVRQGTLTWLKKHHFPEADLITRGVDIPLEEFNLNKNKWKAEILCELFPEIIGIVDDNPVLAHQLEKLGYKGTLYLYGKESSEFKNKEGILVCPTWRDVVDSIKNEG